jgi:hypothetical protein
MTPGMVWVRNVLKSALRVVNLGLDCPVRRKIFPRKRVLSSRLAIKRIRSGKNHERGREPARETTAGAKTAARSFYFVFERGQGAGRCGLRRTGVRRY